jgi:signal transduction histidine kinase
VAVTVRDNGPGVSPEIASRLFEPYATTKAQGTGLGLAIAQRIAIEHQGELSLQESVAGEGEVAGERGVSGVGSRGQKGHAGAAFRLLLSVAGPSMIS